MVASRSSQKEEELINMCVCAYPPYKYTPLLSVIKYIRKHDFTQIHIPPIQQHRVYSGLATFIFVINFFSVRRIDFHYPRCVHLFCSILACLLHWSPVQPSPYWSCTFLVISLFLTGPARTSLHSLHGPNLILFPSWI